MIFNVREFGAVGDGITDDGFAIQAAIDECSKRGGRVLLQGGYTYISSSLVLKDNVDFCVEKGARLVAIKDIEAYKSFDDIGYINDVMLVPSYVNCDYAGKPKKYFIYAGGTTNVSISGQGTIDGSEEIYYGRREDDFVDGSFYPRIPMFYFESCKKITIKDITLTRSGFWTVHMVGCDDVLIDGIRIINSMELANCDGIDPDHCKNVRITNCYIESADDCIVLKNTRNNQNMGLCENITINNCTLISSSAAFKIGTEGCSDFRNIIMSNCNIKGQRGVSLQLRDEGNIENVIISNVNIDTKLASHVWWGEADPIAITAVKRNDFGQVGKIRNIEFSSINCTGENGIFIMGEENPNIENILFDKVNLTVKKITEFEKGKKDLRPCAQKEIFKTGVNAVYARNAVNVEFEHFNVTFDEEMNKELFVKYDISQCAGTKINGGKV